VPGVADRSAFPRLQDSLWDRLTDPAAARGKDVGSSQSSEIERIKDAVRRDLEWLLNARRPSLEIPEEMEALKKSLVMYGLPDFSGVSSGDANERERLQQTLEQAIRDFEPRLSNVKVSFDPTDQDRTRAALHYRVSALLRLDPVPEPIVFDTVLDLSNRAFSVKRNRI
jgi:type VI secretion system protein ImpF